MLYILEEHAADLGFSEVLLSSRGRSDLFGTEKQRAFRASMQLVARAREAGAIRPDFHHSDLYILQHATTGLVRATQRAAPLAWKRLSQYMLQAFRKESAEALTPPRRSGSAPSASTSPDTRPGAA